MLLLSTPVIIAFSRLIKFLWTTKKIESHDDSIFETKLFLSIETMHESAPAPHQYYPS